MKILLDENIDVNFKLELSGYEVKTVKDLGWSGISNGKLLNLAEQNKFDVILTLDSNLKFQQNLSKFRLHFILIKSKDSRLNTLKQFSKEIMKYLKTLKGKQNFEFIEISI